MLLTKEDYERLPYFIRAVEKFSLPNFSDIFNYKKNEGLNMNTSAGDHSDQVNKFSIEFEDSTVPLIVIFRKNSKEYLTGRIKDHADSLEKNNLYRFLILENLSQLPEALMKKPQCLLFYHQGLFEEHASLAEFVMMIKTMIHFTDPETKIKIGFILDLETPYSLIKELQKAGVQGLVPAVNSWGETENIKGIEAMVNGIAYWPKHLIEQLPGQTTKVKRETVHLTPRQKEVLELIANRGLSNKQIARVMGISESTVKIHVSAIMKAYCVRNRTQLALMKK
jgi:DNA-binding CsgD family transcriptional regulator